MLLGAAILGAVASKKYSSLSDSMKALNAAGQVCTAKPDLVLFYFIHFVNLTKVVIYGGYFIPRLGKISNMVY